MIFEDPEGSWNLIWKVEESKNETSEVSVNKAYHFQSGKEIINKIEVTPFYLRVYHGKKGSQEDNYNLPECSVRIKDGTVKKLNWSYSQGADRSANGYAFHQSDFTGLMAPDQIESVIIGGNEIKVSKK